MNKQRNLSRPALKPRANHLQPMPDCIGPRGARVGNNRCRYAKARILLRIEQSTGVRIDGGDLADHLEGYATEEADLNGLQRLMPQIDVGGVRLAARIAG